MLFYLFYIISYHITLHYIILFYTILYYISYYIYIHDVIYGYQLTKSTTIAMLSLHRRWPSPGTSLACAGRRQAGCRGETTAMESPFYWDIFVGYN